MPWKVELASIFAALANAIFLFFGTLGYYHKAIGFVLSKIQPKKQG